jgi:hypothetical protein
MAVLVLETYYNQGCINEEEERRKQKGYFPLVKILRVEGYIFEKMCTNEYFYKSICSKII